MKGSGIYKIYSISKPDRVYVGSSVNIKSRMADHYIALRGGAHHNAKLQNHCSKYGIDDLVFVIIEPCFPEFLIVREQYYIDTLNPYFNIRKIADSNRGVIRSAETRAKISKAIKDLNLIGDKNPWYGKKHTKETRAIIKEKRKYQVISKESIQKGLKTKLGYKHSDETKQKIGIAQKGEKNHRYGKEGNRKGAKHSHETKTKMREAWMLRKEQKEKRLAQQN